MSLLTSKGGVLAKSCGYGFKGARVLDVELGLTYEAPRSAPTHLVRLPEDDGGMIGRSLTFIGRYLLGSLERVISLPSCKWTPPAAPPLPYTEYALTLSYKGVDVVPPDIQE